MADFVKCANNFEMTSDSRRCDAKPTDSAERGGVEFEQPFAEGSV